jgi:hypothetical protein
MAETDVQQAVRGARSILDGPTPLFLGCKQLQGPIMNMGIDREEPFVTIIGVNSETDEYPVYPQERTTWNAQWLAEKDTKLAAYLPKIQEHIFAACRAIIDRFGDSTYASGNWSVYRTDDDGNEFVVQAHIGEDDAMRIVAEFEARRDKQTYWAQLGPSQ